MDGPLCPAKLQSSGEVSRCVCVCVCVVCVCLCRKKRGESQKISSLVSYMSVAYIGYIGYGCRHCNKSQQVAVTFVHDGGCDGLHPAHNGLHGGPSGLVVELVDLINQEEPDHLHKSLVVPPPPGHTVPLLLWSVTPAYMLGTHGTAHAHTYTHTHTHIHTHTHTGCPRGQDEGWSDVVRGEGHLTGVVAIMCAF